MHKPSDIEPPETTESQTDDRTRAMLETVRRVRSDLQSTRQKLRESKKLLERIRAIWRL